MGTIVTHTHAPNLNKKDNNLAMIISKSKQHSTVLMTHDLN